MASEISGLAALRGYLKLGNLVVRLSVPFVHLPQKAAGVHRTRTRAHGRVRPRRRRRRTRDVADAADAPRWRRASSRSSTSAVSFELGLRAPSCSRSPSRSAPRRCAPITRRSSATPARTTTPRATRSAASGTGSSRAEWGLVGDVRGGSLPAARRRPASAHGATARRSTRQPDLHQRARRDGEDHGASRRMGRDVLRPEERVAHRAGRRRCPRARGASRQRRGRARRAERYVQARIGGNHPAETTGSWVAARSSMTARGPVDGYAAPQLHTHVVFFNVTERDTGETRALQPQELYKTQQYATAIYRSELATRLIALGYEIERGASGQPEIRGYTADVPRGVESPAPADRGPPRERPSGAARAPRRSRPTRPAKPKGDTPKRRCSAAIARSRRPTAISRRAVVRAAQSAGPGGRTARAAGDGARRRDVRQRPQLRTRGRRRRARAPAGRPPPVDGGGDRPRPSHGVHPARGRRRVHRGAAATWRAGPRVHHARRWSRSSATPSPPCAPDARPTRPWSAA